METAWETLKTFNRFYWKNLPERTEIQNSQREIRHTRQVLNY